MNRLDRSLSDSGVCYLHAPFFSPALKSVGPVRKALGVRTFFNMLGPLVNPFMPRYQLLGVYNLKLLRLYSYIAQHEGIDCTVVHSLDGYDEISLTSPFKVCSTGEEILLKPEDLGFETVEQNSLSGGETVEEAASIFDRVLAGNATKAQTDCVVANSAFAIRTLEPGISIENAIKEARESIDSGAALGSFRKFVELNS